MRRSRDELTTTIDRMVAMRQQNKTLRQIAVELGYKSPGTVSDLLRKRGHFSIILNALEINFIVTLLKSKPENKLIKGILAKLTKINRGTK